VPTTAQPKAALASWRADGVLVFITAIWGGTFVVVKDALALADPFSFLVMRFLVAGLVLSVVARRALLDARVWRRGGLLGVLLFLGFALQTLGLVQTTPSRSAFITGLCVPMVPWVALVLLKQRPKASALGGIALALVGLYVLTLAGQDLGGATFRGDSLTFGSAVVYAFHITLVEKYSPGVAPSALVAVQAWVTAGASAVCLLFAAPRVQLTPELVWAAVAMGTVATAVAIGLQTWAQQRTTAVRAALIFSLEPIFAALYSTALGRERLGPRELLGGGLVVAGVLVGELGALWSARRERG
jgi:drug/metabolite transporter (DMT)-like permease